jgi:peptide/nickel transport system substrate-binding protein
MHASHGSGYFDSRRTGAGVLHNLAASEYLATCDARLATGDPAEQERLDRQLQQLHADYLPGIALAWTESLYPYREGWVNWTIDHIYGGVVNSFSWFTVTKD